MTEEEITSLQEVFKNLKVFIKDSTFLKIFLTKIDSYIISFGDQYKEVLKTRASKQFGAFFCHHPQKKENKTCQS